jgi:hypothetical protein
MYTQLLLVVFAATTTVITSAQLPTKFSVETKTEKKSYEQHPNTHFIPGFVLDSVFTHHANLNQHHTNGENVRIHHTITRRKLTFLDNHPSLLTKDELIQRRLIGRELAAHKVKVKVSLTVHVEQATKQGYWPVTKQIIEQIRTELMGFEGIRTEEAQLHRMYLQKKYEEKPVQLFSRTELLDDVDPTLFYKYLTVYEHFLDPWGTGIGPDVDVDVGTSCSFEKPKMSGFSVGDILKNELREMKKARAYKYCSKIVGISAPRLMEALALGKQSLKNEFAACRSFTYLSNDDDLLEDGTTNGGCVKYNPDSMVCPTQSMFIAGLGIGIFVLVMVLVMLMENLH